MKPEQWSQVEQLYHAALECAPNERAAYLEQACANDAALRCEVESLLKHDAQAADFIEQPAVAFAAEDLADEQSTMQLGQHISHYQILAPLGKGGMGEVYQARDHHLDRTVALKILPAEVATNAERLRRFVREAKAASALNHSHVATIYEIGAANDIHFIAMEYVEGQTLAAKINGATLAINELIVIGSQIADALDEAHRKGITHRDIKPANVMLNERGQVKVLDFGLAKFLRKDEGGGMRDESEKGTPPHPSTLPGVMMGTVAYMSPEQALGREVDHRSDIFSLGVVLYEMATGKLPFAGANTVETLDRILHAEPDAIAQCNHDAPAALERIVRKCLEKERERRYQSARELLVDLNQLKRESEPTAPPAAQAENLASKSNRYRRGALLALATFILLGAGLAYFVWPPPVPKVTGTTQITNSGHEKFFYSPASYRGSYALVTDGPRVYFTQGAVPTQVSSSGGEAVTIPASFPYSNIWDISPDRSELLVSRREQESEGSLWVLPVLGGSPRRLGDLLGYDATWTPDGRQIVYVNGSALYLAKSDGTESRKFVTVDGRPNWPRWSPDGSRLRFTVTTLGNNSASLWEVAADGTNAHPLLPDWNNPANECCGNWTADGRYFVFQSTRDRSTNIWVRREQTGFFQRGGQEPVQLTIGPLNYYSPAPSLDGQKLFVVGEQKRGELSRYDAKTKQLVSYLGGTSVEHVDFSRDGEWMAYVTFPEGNLWRSRLNGEERRQLSFPPMRAVVPRWSPDGKQLVFVASTPGKPQKAYLISAEGGTPQQLTPDERPEHDPGWSPDGKTLVFAAGTRRDRLSMAFYLLELSTRRLSRLPGSEGLFSPRWSPDGRYLAANNVSLQNKLLLFDFSTQKWSELLSGQVIGWPHWSRDGKSLYFASQHDGGRAIFRVGIGDRKSELWARLKDFRLALGVFGAWFGWTPGDQLLVLRDVGTQDIYALEWQSP